MAATISGALKAYIEGLALGLSAFRDRAGKDASEPYVVIQEGISIVPKHLGDNGVNDAVVEQVQVDLWEHWRNTDHTLAESYTLARQLEIALRSPILTGLPFHVHGVIGLSRTRQVDQEAGLVRNIYTVEIRRDQ